MLSALPLWVIRHRTPLLAALGIEPQPPPVNETTVTSPIQFATFCGVEVVVGVVGVGGVGAAGGCVDEGIPEQAGRSRTMVSANRRRFIATLLRDSAIYPIIVTAAASSLASMPMGWIV